MACNSPAGMIHIKLFYESGEATVVLLHHAFVPSIESLHTISLNMAFVPVIALSLVKELTSLKQLASMPPHALDIMRFARGGEAKIYICQLVLKNDNLMLNLY